jgi:flagellar L-ring protein precursor FlgH
MRSKVAVLSVMVVVGVTVLSGCVVTPPLKTNQQFEAHSEDVMGHQFETMKTPIPSEGSLWTDAGSPLLFVDMRARQVGDLVTVRISEKPTGKLSAKTETSRDSSIEAGIPNLMGVMEGIGGKHALDRTSMFKANFKPSFTGEGSNNRDGELDAYITARVIQVLSSGNMRIRGRQEIKVNSETQHITISGIIRPEDIDTNNEVQSTYVADARIEYSGQGAIADKQRPGWLMRALDHIWPF